MELNLEKMAAEVAGLVPVPIAGKPLLRQNVYRATLRALRAAVRGAGGCDARAMLEEVATARAALERIAGQAEALGRGRAEGTEP